MVKLNEIIDDKNLKNLLLKKKIKDYIFCSGKSGSSTLQNSLPGSLHMHSFLCYCRTSLNNFSFPDKNFNLEFNFFDIVDINMKEHNLSQVYFYDIYRTPIERKMSAFFQHYKTSIKNNPQPMIENIKKHEYLYSYNVSEINKLNFEKIIRNNVEFLIEIFWWNFMINTDNYYSFLEYKDIEEFNIIDKPYFYQDNGKYKYIVLKFDNINLFSNYLSEIHKKEIIIKPKNITSKESECGINDLYELFKKKFIIPKVLFKLIFYKDHRMHNLHPICNHYKIMKKFKSDDEINNYINYWDSRSNDIIPEYLYDDKLTSKNIIDNILNYFKNNPIKKINII